MIPTRTSAAGRLDRKSTRLNSSHTEIYTLSLHDALPISPTAQGIAERLQKPACSRAKHAEPHDTHAHLGCRQVRSEEHTSELQSHRDLHSFPTRRSSDLSNRARDSRAPAKTCLQPSQARRAP